MPGMQLANRYTVLHEVGRGGMGTVYAVYDAKLNRRVALKILHTHAPGDDAGNAHADERLLREAQAMARINHPNVVSVYDVGQLADGEVFLALELVDGQTLRGWLGSAKPGWRAILDVFIAAGRGLAAVHAAGLVHRDFKPANVLVGADGRPRVTDFGVVRARRSEADAPAAATLTPGQSSTMSEGTVAGTPRYMAPEIFEGHAADVRSDLYSFCLALYEALYDRHPFADDKTSASPLDALPDRDVSLPRATTLPAWVGHAVVAGLRLAPEERPPSMGTLLAMLTRDPHEERLHWLLRAGAVGVTALVALLVWGAWRAQQASRAQLCQGAEQQLAGVWDAAARRRVEAALLATHQPFAANTWRNLRETIDRYVAGWAEMRRDSCVATRLRRDQSETLMTLRMACLDKRRQSLAAVVDVLARADETVVERAEQAVTALPSLAGCADVPALLAEVAPPEDRAVRARVQELRQKLAQAMPLRLAGKLPEAQAVADAALAAARGVGYAPLVSEALLESARAHLAEAPGPALPLLTEALWAAHGNGNDRLAASAAVALVEAHSVLNHPSEWKIWQDYASAALRRIGGDVALEAELRSALAMCNHEQGRYAEAYEQFARGAQLMRQAYGPRDVRTLEEERNALIALNNIGREEEARAGKQALLARTEELLGPHHPQTARMLLTVAYADAVLGYLREAQELLARTQGILERIGQPDSRVALTYYHVAAQVALQQGRYAEAARLGARGLEVNEHLGMRANTVALSLLASMHTARARRGHGAEALAALEEELRRAEAAMGADNPAIGMLLVAMGDVAELRGQRGEALALRERSARLMRSRNANDMNRVDEAQLELERSLARARPAEVVANGNHRRLLATAGAQSVVALKVRLARGEALLGLGRPAEAGVELAQAVRIADAAGADANVRGAARAALARARWAAAGPGEALREETVAALVDEAMRDFARAEVPDALARAELARWARAHGVTAAEIASGD